MWWRERQTPPPARQQRVLPGPQPFMCLVQEGVASPLATGTAHVPTIFCCRGSLSGHPNHCYFLSKGGRREGPHSPELAHLGQYGEVLILVLL